MKDIKEVRQELDYFINMDLCAYCEYEGACDLSIGVCGKRQAKNALKRFINDTENLIKENEELKKKLEKPYGEIKTKTFVIKNDDEKVYKEIARLQNNGCKIIEQKEFCKRMYSSSYDYQGTYPCITIIYEEPKPNSLHDSQAIEPSVLEKIDKLERENKEITQKLGIMEMLSRDYEKQLAITDKALDKACKEKAKKEYIDNVYATEYRVNNRAKEIKDYLLKESEKEQ